MPLLQVNELRKRYGELEVLREVSLSLEAARACSVPMAPARR